MRDTLRGCAASGVGWIGLWRHKVEEIGHFDTTQLLRGCGLRASSLCRGGFFPAPTEQERQQRLDDNRRAIDEAAALGADVLVLVCGPPVDRDLRAARQMIEDGIAVDAYHVWWDPEVEAQIARAAGRILGFHVSDWLVPPPDHLLGRGYMGDGVIDIRRLRACVE